MRLVSPLARRPLLLLAAAASISLSTPFPAFAADPAPVATAFNQARGEKITLEGKVQDFRASSKPNIPNSITLADESGTIRVAIWPNVFEQIAARDRISEGATLRVTGEVAEYRGKAEIHVRAADGVEVVGGGSGTPAPATGATTGSASAATRGGAERETTGPAIVNAGVSPISALSRDRINQTFTISGKLNSARRPTNERAPYILKVSDPTGEIDVVFWEDLASRLPESKKAEPGDRLQLTGKLGLHRDTLQLRLSSPEDVKTPKSDPALFQESKSGDAATTVGPRAAVEPVTPAELAAQPVGKRVRLEGQVSGIEPLRLGRKVRLQAETTGPEAVLLLWDTAEGLKPAVRQLKTSSSLAVAGTVAETRGNKVVVVSDPEDVLSVTP